MTADDNNLIYNIMFWQFRPGKNGKAAFTVFTEIKAHFESFKKYFIEDEIKWIESWIKNKD